MNRNHAMRLQNFGRNLEWHPAAYYEPQNEHEVLEILDRHRGEQIRAIGSLHSWSEVPVCDGVIVNMKKFQQVDLQRQEQSSWVVVGAGCQIKTLLTRLKQDGQTLPSVGLITEQTIAGAISTGTHGSGRHSLSHYVDAVRVARYDAVTGKAMAEEINSGDALRSARCSLGCLGLILSVRIRCRDQYNVEEHMRAYPTLEPVLAAEQEFPLQHFFFVPWRWTFLAQHRREVSHPRSRFASLYRLHWFLCIDLALHLLILFAVRVVASAGFLRFLYRHIIPRTVIHGWKVTDESSAMLVMEHELFRHIEIELFVPSEHLSHALDDLRRVLIVAGNFSKLDATKPPGDGRLDPNSHADGGAGIAVIRGTYCHHYPICVRRVLADDTLISMASGDDQVWYAISLISYARPTERDGFLKVAKYLAESLAQKYGVRPHWGKVCPGPAHQIVSLYPRFDRFRTVCQSLDPQGAFRNRWIHMLFGDQSVP